MRRVRQIKQILIPLVLIVFGLMSPMAESIAQTTATLTYVKIQVDGLSCPFCAYGLDKNLKKIDGASEVFISVVKGYTTFQVPVEKLPAKKELTKIVEDAGFTAREITFAKEPFAKEEEEN